MTGQVPLFRSLWRRVASPPVLRQGALFGLVVWGCCALLDYRTLGPLVAWLSLIGLGLSVLSFFMLVNSFYGEWLEGDLARRVTLWVGRGTNLLMGAFVLYSVFVYINGRFDQSSPIEQRSVVIGIERTTVPGGFFGDLSVAKIRSWDQSGGTKSLLLAGNEPRTLWVGEPVLVHLRAGAAGLPWVSQIDPDEEQYWRGLLSKLPGAAEAWKRLLVFYLKHHRPKDAADVARQYFDIRPDDFEFACDVAASLAVMGLRQEALSLLEPFAAKQPDYRVYGVLAYLYHKMGDEVHALQFFQAAIKLDPENPEAYIDLGYAYKDMGKSEEAIAMFKKVLQYRPIFPEMNEQIHLLQQKLVARPRS